MSKMHDLVSAAKVLGCEPGTVGKLMRIRALKHVVIGGRHYVTQEALDDFKQHHDWRDYLAPQRRTPCRRNSSSEQRT